MAEGRGKAQADTLRRSRAETQAHRLKRNDTIEAVPSSKLRSGSQLSRPGSSFPATAK
jgi:K+-transporting ATPase ATPase B chain